MNQIDSEESEPQLVHGAYYAKTLFDRHEVPNRSRTELVRKLLKLSYSPAHRRVRGLEPWTFEELETVAANFGETVQSVVVAAANQDAEHGTFLVGGLRARCKFSIGFELQSPRAGTLVAVRSDDGWLVTTWVDELKSEDKVFQVREVSIEASVAGRRIAVLDDDVDITDSLCDYLRSFGFVAEPFSSIADLEAARDSGFDAFILDWLIGTTTVRNLIAKIRKDDPHCPIAVLTGQSESGPGMSDIAETLATQSVLFFEKPIRSAILTATLAKLLGIAPRNRA